MKPVQLQIRIMIFLIILYIQIFVVHMLSMSGDFFIASRFCPLGVVQICQRHQGFLFFVTPSLPTKRIL